MQESEFDKFANEYYTLHEKNIRLSGEAPEFFAEYKIRDVFQLLSGQVNKTQHILDFGSGVGGSVPYFRKFFPDASLLCLDVSEKSLEIGRSRFTGIADFKSFDGKRIPVLDNTFDLVFAACVFHHIPHSTHVELLQEWHRVTKPGGTAIIYEHNPFNPITVRAVNSCPFDENAELIRAKLLKEGLEKAGFQNVGIRYRLFFPRIFRTLRPLEKWLYNIPFGAQYFVHGTK